jgi:hypothetical protein
VIGKLEVADVAPAIEVKELGVPVATSHWKDSPENGGVPVIDKVVEPGTEQTTFGDAVAEPPRPKVAAVAVLQAGSSTSPTSSNTPPP